MKDPSYRVILRGEPEGGYIVTVPSLPGLITSGLTVEDALKKGEDAIKDYIRGLVANEENIPTDDNTLEYLIRIRMRK
jgi:predicted RNase H-like HicB family nuclease